MTTCTNIRPCSPCPPPPVPTISQTFLFSALGADPECMTADCVGGTGACSQVNGVGWLTVILTLIVIFLIVLQIGQYGYLFISLQRKGQFKMNAMGVTIICAVLGLIFEIIWALSFVLEVFTGSDAYYNAVGGTVGVPGEAFCVFAAMTVCLMWNQVATASKSMKKTTDKMDKKPLYFVCAMCGSFALVIIALSIAIPRSIAILGTWWENPEPDYCT